jgi:hypothetical protein
VGRQLADVIIPPSLREKHRQGLTRYLATGEARVLGRRVEVTAIRADGREFPAELAITRIPLEGPVLYWLSTRHHGTQTVGGGTAALSGIPHGRTTPQCHGHLLMENSDG